MKRISHIRHSALTRQSRRLALAAACLGFLLTPVPVYGAPGSGGSGSGGGGCGSFFFLKGWDCYVHTPITNIMELVYFAVWAADSLLKLAAYVSAGFIIFGGIKYMMAQGDQSELSQAKSTVTNAVIGLIVAIASVAIVQFVAGAIL